MNNFECFIVAVKSRYERLTGYCFVTDFGSDAVERLKSLYDQGLGRDDSVAFFLKARGLNLESQDVFQN